MSVTFPLKGDLKHMNAQYQHIVIMINRFRESPESMSWFSSKNCSSSLEGVKLKPWLRIICSNVIWSNVHDKNVNTERYLCISDYFHSILIFFIVYEHLNTGRKLEDLKFVLNLYLIKWISKVYPDCSKVLVHADITASCSCCRTWLDLHKPVIQIIYCNTVQHNVCT